MVEGNRDNHEPVKGATFDLETLARPDGIITTSILNSQRDKSGVLQTAMTAIEKNKDYRQELKTACFTSPRKQMQMVLALDECRECGIDETMVVDLLIAQKAGINGGLLHEVLMALTHTTFTNNFNGKAGGRRWYQGEPKNGSPISDQ